MGASNVVKNVAISKNLDELQAIVDAMPLLFFHKDTQNRILRANKAAADSLGVRPEDMVGTDTAQWYPDEAEEYFRDDLAVMRSGQPRFGIIEQLQVEHEEKHWICTDKFPHHDAQGNIDGILVFIRDATAEAAANAARRHSEEKLSSILAAAPDLMLVLDEEGRLLEIFGSTRPENLVAPAEELLGKRVHDLLPHDIATAGQVVIDRTIATGSLHEHEYSLEVRGTVQSFCARVVPFDTEQGPCVLWSARNVTAQKEAEQHRRVLELKVQESQKLESLGVLAGGIAHDFNNLLVSMLGNATLAAAEIDPGSSLATSLGAIEEAALRAADLCQQMLAYSGRGRFVVEPVDLSQIVRGMSELLSTATGKKATIRRDLAADLPLVEADATQVGQVVMNLITNASEALGDDAGEISISTGTTDCDAALLADCLGDREIVPGSYVFFECADTGCGMDESETARMFDPFFTTKFTGRGLGLAAVLGIVKSHRGAIRVRSRRGKGTALQVLFPPAAVDTSTKAKQAAKPRVLKASGTVLLVDDEAAVREVGRRVLESAGLSVRTAANGREAIDSLHDEDDIVCIVLDLTMPVLGGLEAFRELRQMRGDVPVILCSGYNEHDLAHQFAQEGFAGFLQKPYRPERMVDLVRSVLCD